MLESIKRLFAAKPGASDWRTIADWAQRRSFDFKPVRGHDGFVIEGVLEDKPWRLEWGPAQRDYIGGRELRLRMELALPADAQMLVLSRALVDTLERRTFEDFTDSLQTTVGAKTPEEMRWLVMFPKVELTKFGALRQHFGSVAATPAVGAAWIDGPLAHLLEEAATSPAGLLRGAPPFVLMTQRGRAYLRMRLEVPEPQDVAAAIALFETAVSQAARAAGEGGTAPISAAPSGSSGWDDSSIPPEPPGKGPRR